MKEKDLPCFGLVFTACSVLGRLLALYQDKTKPDFFFKNQHFALTTLTVAEFIYTFCTASLTCLCQF